MKKRNLFLITNALLTLIIGVIFGLTCGESIFINAAGISAFVCLLVTLCLPSIIYVFANKITAGERIISILFILAEIALNIVFMAKPSFGIKSFWISQAILVGILLIALLIIIALFKSEEEK